MKTRRDEKCSRPVHKVFYTAYHVMLGPAKLFSVSGGLELPPPNDLSLQGSFRQQIQHSFPNTL